MSNFWRSLDLPLINCVIELDLSWPKECIISGLLITPRIPANPTVAAVAAIQTTGATFQELEQVSFEEPLSWQLAVERVYSLFLASQIQKEHSI